MGGNVERRAGRAAADGAPGRRCRRLFAADGRRRRRHACGAESDPARVGRSVDRRASRPAMSRRPRRPRCRRCRQVCRERWNRKRRNRVAVAATGTALAPAAWDQQRSAHRVPHPRQSINKRKPTAAHSHPTGPFLPRLVRLTAARHRDSEIKRASGIRRRGFVGSRLVCLMVTWDLA